MLTTPAEPNYELDPVPFWKVLVRSMHPLRVIRMRRLQGPFTDDGFVEAAMAAHRDSAAAGTINERCVALWKMEWIGFSYCRHGAGILHRPSILVAMQPIVHTGLGFAAVEEAALQPDKVRESIDRRAHPDFRHFAYESVGCAWGVLNNGRFRKLFEMFTGVRFAPFDPPAPAEFMARFPAELRPLLSHGYGRTLYFVHCDLAKSLRSAATATWLETSAAVHGVAFAYVMINFADLDRILDVRPDLPEPALAEDFASGLVFALAMLSWTFPGMFDTWSSRPPRQTELFDRAERLVRDSRDCSYFNSPVLSAGTSISP
jgi:hypothetical protein